MYPALGSWGGRGRAGPAKAQSGAHCRGPRRLRWVGRSSRSREPEPSRVGADCPKTPGFSGKPGSQAPGDEEGSGALTRPGSGQARRSGGAGGPGGGPWPHPRASGKQRCIPAAAQSAAEGGPRPAAAGNSVLAGWRRVEEPGAGATSPTPKQELPSLKAIGDAELMCGPTAPQRTRIN